MDALLDSRGEEWTKSTWTTQIEWRVTLYIYHVGKYGVKNRVESSPLWNLRFTSKNNNIYNKNLC